MINKQKKEMAKINLKYRFRDFIEDDCLQDNDDHENGYQFFNRMLDDDFRDSLRKEENEQYDRYS